MADRYRRDAAKSPLRRRRARLIEFDADDSWHGPVPLRTVANHARDKLAVSTAGIEHARGHAGRTLREELPDHEVDNVVRRGYKALHGILKADDRVHKKVANEHRNFPQMRALSKAFVRQIGFGGRTTDGRSPTPHFSQVLRCHFADFGLPGNFRALTAFAHHVRHIWFRSLCRWRQQRTTGAMFEAILNRFPVPRPRIMPPCVP